MLADIKYRELVNRAIVELLWDALRISVRTPRQAFFILQMVKIQKRAVRRREKWDLEGVQVPPFAILSVTNKCNLQCKGCYARIHHSESFSERELSAAKLKNILQEAQELGISIILIAGGEPLNRKELLAVLEEFPEIIFPLFTNGLLIDKVTLKILQNHRNIIPIVSLEGFQKETDERRGFGVYENIQNIIRNMRYHRIFYGTSLTVTSANFEMVTGAQFIRELIMLGCRIFFFVEYIPVQEGTENLVITKEQRGELVVLVATLRRKYSGLFIAFPGDEEKFGGCLAAGRGFIHINAQGNIEPCPFAPYSDSDLSELSLKDALKSTLLKTIRDHAGELEETKGGCALWEKREWVRTLTEKNRDI